MELEVQELRLSKEGIEAVRNDADLFAAVCKALKNVAPGYLTQILNPKRKNHYRLTQMNVLQIISDKTGIGTDALTVAVR